MTADLDGNNARVSSSRPRIGAGMRDQRYDDDDVVVDGGHACY